MPVKPRTPATIDTSKKINAHFRIVIATAPALGPRHGLCEIADLTSGKRTGSGKGEDGRRFDRRLLTEVNYRPNFPGNPDGPIVARQTAPASAGVTIGPC
jgi:hypothetical protein